MRANITMSRHTLCSTTKLVIVALFALMTIDAGAQDRLTRVPDGRFNHLRHGINLSNWFAQSKSYDPQHIETYMTAADFDLIKSAGFDHVRLTLEPAPLFNYGQPDKLNPDYLKLVDNAVQMALQRDLAVIIDIHPSGDFKQKLAREDGQVERFGDFWHSLAAHYASTNPERIFFEVLNEPEVFDPYRWYGIQVQLVNAIRTAAPLNTIIVSGAGWANLENMIAMEPLTDGNLIYNFHYYQPYQFTHQGATWGEELWHHLPRVHYPSHPGANTAVIDALPQYTQKVQILHYDQDRWDRERIDADMALVAEWAKANHVRVTCNEFGAFRPFAAPEDRDAWIHDVRSSLEAHDIGWAMWDYSGGFDVAPGKPGNRTLDHGVLHALGLK
jgi:endoglucanase